jgi:hypothetical protein
VVSCMKRRIVEEWKHGWIEKRIKMRWREVLGDWLHATGNGASVTENEIGIGCDACTGEGLCCVLGICYVTSVRWMQIHSCNVVLNLGRWFEIARSK